MATTTEQRLNRLVSVSRALMSAREVDEVVALILEAGLELCDAEGCSMALVDRAAQQLSFVAMEGASKTKPFRIPLGQGIAGAVVASAAPIVVADVRTDPRFLARVDADTGFETRSLLCIPILERERVIGVMQALNSGRAGGFDDSDRDLLGALGGLAFAALGRTRDEQVLRSAEEQLREEAEERYRPLASSNPAMREVLRLARTAAKSTSTVLLLGESGTGKEVLARTVHRHSPRHAGPFIGVNCVALTPTLLESELFGHERGAFTGATAQKRGKFELADSGTLFLDEIGDLAPELQTKLLRVLQEREFERVGGSETLRADVRVVAATNRDLASAIRNGQFREDLFYRLNVITLNIPPLRERSEDIPALCKHFVMRASAAVKRPACQLSSDALDALCAYRWPGNIRELVNVMERLVVLSESRMITAAELPPEITGAQPERHAPRALGERLPLVESLRAFKRDLLREALAQCDGHQANAAAMLGVAPSNLSRMLKDLGLR